MRFFLVIALTSGCVGGCVSGLGAWKREQVTMPMLGGAVAADLVVSGVVAAQVDDFTTAAVIGTALAITAVDVTIGCLLGACAPLRL